MFHTRDVKRSIKKKKNMSGKSGQVLTSSFYDDCENIILYNGYPVFVVNHDELFQNVVRLRFRTFELASKMLGLSVDVLKDLTRLANVKLLSKQLKSGGGDILRVLPLISCQSLRPNSTLSNILETVEFGDVSNGLYTLYMEYNSNGELEDGYIQYTLE